MILLTIILGLIIIFLIFVIHHYRKQIEKAEEEIIKLRETKFSKAFSLGSNQIKGFFAQILGTFAMLNEYDEIIILSTTSKQPSLDLLGIKNDSLDFIELKKSGAMLTSNERKIKKLVEQKKVKYKIIDVELPENTTIKERIKK